MRISVLLVAVIPTFALIQASAAETESATTTMSAPGKVEMAQVVEGSAVITAIDKAKRTFDVKRQNGDEVTIDAGPGLKSFDQLKVGDTVSVSYTESLALELKKGGGMKVEKTEVAAMIPAKPGEAPAGAAGRQVTVVGDVIEVDTSTQTITVKGPQRTVHMKVRDPEQFKRVAVGDQIEATYTEAVALSVTPAAKPAAADKAAKG